MTPTSHSKKVYASSRSGTGHESLVCDIPGEYGVGDNLRVWDSTGVVDKSAGGSAHGRLIYSWICLIEGQCGNCKLAELVESQQE